MRIHAKIDINFEPPRLISRPGEPLKYDETRPRMGIMTVCADGRASDLTKVSRVVAATLEAINAERPDYDRELGQVARLAFAGAWRAAVEAYEMHADVERLPEVERLLTRAVREAAKHNLGDAIDAARSALASCPGVPALAQDVARIIAILEAP